jgi:hypothetical protein
MGCEVHSLDTGTLVQLAWDALPGSHRRLLTHVGASQWEVVNQGLGNAIDERLRSAGETAPSQEQTRAGNEALGMWVPELRLVLINEAHPALLTADLSTREALTTWVAWHEWGHALSVTNISSHDPGEGTRLLALAPDGIRERIRRGNYPRREYIHELIAETYALLMRERIEGRPGQPPWLPKEIYQLISRIET